MGTATGQSPRQDTIRIVVPAAAQAATESTTLFSMPYTGVISSVTYVPDTAITGANTNTRKVSLVNKGTTGSGTTEMAALQFDSGVNGTAFDEKTITLSGTAANLNVASGDVVAWVSAAVSSGLADPGGTVFVTITRD